MAFLKHQARKSGSSGPVSRLGPSTHETHEESPEEHQKASVDTLTTAEESPAFVTEEVLRKKLNQRGKGEKSSRNGIHDTNNNEASFRVGAVECVGSKADSLPQRSTDANVSGRYSTNGSFNTYVHP